MPDSGTSTDAPAPAAAAAPLTTAASTATSAVATAAGEVVKPPTLVPLGTTAVHPLFPHDILSISPTYFEGVAKRDESAMNQRAPYLCTVGTKTTT